MIRLNKVMRKNKNTFNALRGKRVVLNKSLLTNKDIVDFEYEAKAKVFYNIPPLDERKRNEVIADFLSRIGLTKKDKHDKDDGKILGLFKNKNNWQSEFKSVWL